MVGRNHALGVGGIALDSVTVTRDFTYNADGRLATFQSNDTRQLGNSKDYSFFYIESADRLIVNVIDIHYPPTPLLAQTWTFEFDANHRAVRDAVDADGDGFQPRVPYRSLPAGEGARVLDDLGAAGTLIPFR